MRVKEKEKEEKKPTSDEGRKSMGKIYAHRVNHLKMHHAHNLQT